ncbi:MAG TPA: non-heme iron oxygenase ferredoxin subunit [Actinomycetota bacterium]|nr:non-heme iron oxygenase ferredoxin subunit [Actinomycetota bacterium]
MKIGSASEVGEGEVLSFSVGARQVAVANVEGDLHGFDDWCSHQQCSLAEGDLDGAIVECPCHGSLFDVITGEAVQGPASDPIDVFEVREEDGELEVLMTQE